MEEQLGAKANHNGAFVWGDSFDGDKASSSADEFSVYQRRRADVNEQRRHDGRASRPWRQHLDDGQ